MAYIGQHIVEYEQKGKDRAEYGTELLKRLSEDLTKAFGKGYSYRNLRLFKQFYTTFPIVQTLSAQLENQKGQPLSAKSKNPIWQPVVAKSKNSIVQPVVAESSNTKLQTAITKLSWTHFVRLLSVRNEDERNFYIIETAENNWSKRELDRQINASLFERLLLSKDKKAVRELAEKGWMSVPDIC